MKKLPLSQNENVVVQNVGKEVLIYNLLTNKAYCLNETCGIVFSACDSKTSFDELKSKYKFTDDLIYFALDELKRENLIKDETATHFAGLSRREVVRKIGLATMIALPVISSLVAPKAVNAGSCINPAGCIPDNWQQSNCCPGSRCFVQVGAFCSPCLQPGEEFASAPGFPTSVAFCDAQPYKPRCCNPGPPSIASGDTCLCG